MQHSADVLLPILSALIVARLSYITAWLLAGIFTIILTGFLVPLGKAPTKRVK